MRKKQQRHRSGTTDDKESPGHPPQMPEDPWSRTQTCPACCGISTPRDLHLHFSIPHCKQLQVKGLFSWIQLWKAKEILLVIFHPRNVYMSSREGQNVKPRTRSGSLLVQRNFLMVDVCYNRGIVRLHPDRETPMVDRAV